VPTNQPEQLHGLHREGWFINQILRSKRCLGIHQVGDVKDCDFCRSLIKVVLRRGDSRFRIELGFGFHLTSRPHWPTRSHTVDPNAVPAIPSCSDSYRCFGHVCEDRRGYEGRRCICASQRLLHEDTDEWRRDQVDLADSAPCGRSVIDERKSRGSGHVGWPSRQASFSRRMSRYVDRHFAFVDDPARGDHCFSGHLVPIIVAVGYSFTNFNLISRPEFDSSASRTTHPFSRTPT